MVLDCKTRCVKFEEFAVFHSTWLRTRKKVFELWRCNFFFIKVKLSNYPTLDWRLMNSHLQWLPPRFKRCAIVEQSFSYKLLRLVDELIYVKKRNSQLIRRWSRSSHADETFKGRCAIDCKSQSNFLHTKYFSAPIEVQCCITILHACDSHQCLPESTLPLRVFCKCHHRA